MAVKRKKAKERTRKKKQSQFVQVMIRLSRNKVAMGALIVLLLIIFCAVFSEQIAPYDYKQQDLRNTFAKLSWEHILGTDNLGRDLLSRILVGGKISLLVAFVSVLFAAVVGSFFGATAGFFGGMYETVVMKCTDILMAIPGFLLAITISSALGSGIFNTALAVGIASIPRFVRLMRAEVLTVRGQEYIEAARLCGSTNGRTIWKHVIPNSLSSTIVNITLGLSGAIMQISGLSFIGLGVQPPTPEWGSILSTGRQFIRDYWPMATFPGLAIVITLLAFNLLGDGLRDAMDPKLKN